jgi:hypothetical protein
MKLKYLLTLIIVTLTGCSSIYHNTDKNTHFSNKAIVFLETKGGSAFGKEGLKIRTINGRIPKDDLSTSKVEFKPDKYEIEFSSYQTRSEIAAFFFSPLQIINITGINLTKIKKSTFTLDLKGGHLYLVSFTYNDEDEIEINIEEV